MLILVLIIFLGIGPLGIHTSNSELFPLLHSRCYADEQESIQWSHLLKKPYTLVGQAGVVRKTFPS